MLLSTKNRDLMIKALQSDSPRASYCFFGDEGVGKTMTSLEVASYLETGEYESRNLIDAQVFTENEKGTIGIDEVRKIKEFCSTRPLKSKYRTAIIRYGESMTDHAQSALLKLFEEPNEHTLLILIVRSKEALVVPLVSRLQSLYFPRFSKKQIVDYLVTNEKIAGSIAEKIAERSFGSIGRAEKLMRNDSVSTESGASEVIEKTIENLYLAGAQKNAHVLANLLRKEAQVKEFSVNEGLQKRAIGYIESEL